MYFKTKILIIGTSEIYIKTFIRNYYNISVNQDSNVHISLFYNITENIIKDISKNILIEHLEKYDKIIFFSTDKYINIVKSFDISDICSKLTKKIIFLPYSKFYNF